jgi:hypothetical protein
LIQDPRLVLRLYALIICTYYMHLLYAHSLTAWSKIPG